MKTTLRLLAIVALFTLTLSPLLAADWPGFRGSRGGVADDTNLPTSITKENVLWKVKLPGAGTSSPITWSGKIYLTCNADYGTEISKGFAGGFGKGGKGGFGKGGADTGEQKKLKLLVLCLDQKTGDILWQKAVCEPRSKMRRLPRSKASHPLHNIFSPQIPFASS